MHRQSLLGSSLKLVWDADWSKLKVKLGSAVRFELVYRQKHTWKRNPLSFSPVRIAEVDRSFESFPWAVNVKTLFHFRRKTLEFCYRDSGDHKISRKVKVWTEKSDQPICDRQHKIRKDYSFLCNNVFKAETYKASMWNINQKQSKQGPFVFVSTQIRLVQAAD